MIPKLLHRNFASREVKNRVRGWEERSEVRAMSRPSTDVVVQRAKSTSSSLVAPKESFSAMSEANRKRGWDDG